MTKSLRLAWWSGAGFLTCFTLVLALTSGASSFGLWTDDLGSALAALAAAVACWKAARTEDLEPQARRAWWFLGGASLSWALGELVWTGYECVLDKAVPFPGVPDIGFAVLYPLAAMGVVSFVRSPSRVTATLRGPIEALIVATSLFLTGWLTVIRPIAESSDSSTAAHVLSLAYLLGDIVMVGLGLFGLSRTPVSRRPVLWLLITGVMAIAVSDASFAYLESLGTYGNVHLLDIGWPLGFVLVAIAAVRSRTTPEAATGPLLSHKGGLALTLVPVSMALVASGASEIQGIALGRVGLAAASLNIVLLMALLWSVIRENHQLTHFLQDLVDSRTAQLSKQESYFEALTENASDVVTLLDSDGMIRYQSPSGERLHGRPLSSLRGTPYSALILADDVRELELAFGAAMGHGSSSVQSRAVMADGRLSYLDTKVVNLLDDLSVRGLLLTSRDTTERVQLQREMAHQASHDGLTALPLRGILHNRAEQMLAFGRDVALLLVNLDEFTDIKNGFGREVADTLLVHVAAALVGCASPRDVVARMGGDEFAILLADATPVEAELLARRVLSALLQPHLIAGVEVVLQARVGIATTQASPRDADQLLRDADLALLAANNDDLAPIVVFGVEVQAAHADKAQMRVDLRRALDAKEFFLQYQPVFDLVDGKLLGVEALVRWQHPERGVIPPLDFIPLAEESGLIVRLGRYVLETACVSAVAWRELIMDDREFHMSVNVSARQLRDPGFVDDVRRILGESGLPPTALVMEITETALLKDIDEATVLLAQIKELGVRIAIDDFGVGYSSLSYLHQLPLDILKVDRSFVSGVTTPGAKALLTRAVLELAAALGLATVAEGVETDAQADVLRGMGCRQAQGFLFARPLDGTRLEELLASANLSREHST